MNAPAGYLRLDGHALLVFDIRVEHEITDTFLGRRVGDRPEKREAAALAVDGCTAVPGT